MSNWRAYDTDHPRKCYGVKFPFIRCPENIGQCEVVCTYSKSMRRWEYEHYLLVDNVVDVNPEGVLYYPDTDLINCKDIDAEWLRRRNELWLRFQADHRNWTKPFSIDDFDEESERKRLRVIDA